VIVNFMLFLGPNGPGRPRFVVVVLLGPNGAGKATTRMFGRAAEAFVTLYAAKCLGLRAPSVLWELHPLSRAPSYFDLKNLPGA
jgi:hypothetical protein